MDKIIVLDFGSQYAHLICRRIRECKVYSELVPYNISADELKRMQPNGLIFSGGPASVYGLNAPMCDKEIFDLGLPILGICYGHQLLVHNFGGKVKKANREYGSADLIIDDSSDLFKSLNTKIRCWMSHGDAAEKLPSGFKVLAHTNNSFAAAIGNKERSVYGIQFHPEVAHTERGIEILKNFSAKICKAKQEWDMKNFLDITVQEIRKQVGNETVLCATSGGIDSTATALLTHRAVGDSLRCVFVNHGLLREGEEDEVVRMFKDNLGIKLIYNDAQERFLKKLQGVADPEKKRMIIGEEFAKVFEEVAKEHGPFQWLAQGTLYPDVIESGIAKGPAARIKSHHNVAGLPDWLNFKVVEPLCSLYKDEVKQVAELLGMPEHLIKRHPFPGPGLAVRIIGEVTKEKIEICKRASGIVEEELMKANLYDKVWQAFAVVGSDKAVGVLGDERVYGNVVTVRIVESVDAMTADWARLPYDLLEKISNRITNEIEGVTWVTYAVSSKPPAT
ncbi:MAG: glutamine-hydrolyzing GMP synthase, partial [Nitrososphaerales archaeon]